MNTAAADVDITVVSMPSKICCGLLGKPNAQPPCDCSPGTKPKQIIAKQSAKLIAKALSSFADFAYRCGSIGSDQRATFMTNVKSEASALSYAVDESALKLFYPIELEFNLM